MRRRLALCFGIMFTALELGAQSASVPRELKPHHAAASVGNLDRAIQWYHDKLGFKLVLRQYLTPNREIAWLTVPGYRIDLLCDKNFVAPPRPKGITC
jgi:hypothetical protein